MFLRGPASGSSRTVASKRPARRRTPRLFHALIARREDKEFTSNVSGKGGAIYSGGLRRVVWCDEKRPPQQKLWVNGAGSGSLPRLWYKAVSIAL